MPQSDLVHDEWGEPPGGAGGDGVGAVRGPPGRCAPISRRFEAVGSAFFLSAPSHGRATDEGDPSRPSRPSRPGRAPTALRTCKAVLPEDGRKPCYGPRGAGGETDGAKEPEPTGMSSKY